MIISIKPIDDDLSICEVPADHMVQTIERVSVTFDAVSSYTTVILFADVTMDPLEGVGFTSAVA
jgi:hypothetical protein